MKSTEDNLHIPVRYNKDGSINQANLNRCERAALVKLQLKEYEENPRLILHHTSHVSGYISRKNGIKTKKYNGKYGVGYIIDIPNFEPNAKLFERRYYLFTPPPDESDV